MDRTDSEHLGRSAVRPARLIAHALACAGIALCLRWSRLTESLWVDELHTAWAAVGPWHDIARRAALGNQSPLFPGIEWLLIRWLGPQEAVLRGFSLACGLALVVVIHGLVFRLTQRMAWADLAACVAAFDTHCIFHSWEARPYAAVQLVGLAHFALFLRIMGGTTAVSIRALHIAMGCLAFWLHFTAGLVFVAESVALAWMAVASRSHRRVAIIGVQQLTLIAIGCSPALPQLLAIASRRDVWNTLGEAGHWSGMLVVLHGGAYAIAPVALYLLDCGMHKMILAPPSAPPRHHATFPWLHAVAWLVPVSTAWILSRGHWLPIFLNRYMAVATAAPIMVATVLGGNIRSRHLRAIAMLAILGSAGYVNDVPRLWDSRLAPESRQEDWRGVVEELNEGRVGKVRDYPILVRAGLVEADADQANWQGIERDEYLTYPLRSLYPLAEPTVLVPIGNGSDFELATATRDAIRSAGGLWLIVRGPVDRSDAYCRRVRELLGGDWHVTSRSEHGRVQLARLERP